MKFHTAQPRIAPPIPLRNIGMTKSLLIAAVAVLTLAACGDNASKKGGAMSSSPSSSPSSSSSSPSTPPSSGATGSSSPSAAPSSPSAAPSSPDAKKDEKK